MSLEARLQTALGAGYVLDRELHGGAMSRVFVARDVALKRDVVVKVLPPDLLSGRSLDRFQREIELTAQLQHPHIVPLISAGAGERLLYFVTPYISGESLRARLSADWRPTFAEAVSLTLDVLRALRFAHERGIVHRDIKPGNILVAEGHAVLADFGLARALATVAQDDGATQSGTSHATGKYTAPERPAGREADLYAIAAVLYELLTGSPPAPGLGAAEIRKTVLAACSAENDRARVAGVADALARALDVNPSVRFASADALRSALSGAPERRVARRPAIAAAGVAAAVLVGWFVMTKRDVTPQTGGAPASQQPVMQATPARRIASAPVTPSADSAADSVASASTSEAKTTSPVAAPRADSAAAPAHDSPLIEALVGAIVLDSPNATDSGTIAATRILADSAAFSPHDVALAHGVQALADRRMPDACASFERAKQAREDFGAWMGIGECQRRDSLVVLDASGPRFRTSFWSAARAFDMATRFPGGEYGTMAYQRMQRVVFLNAELARPGADTLGRRYAGIMDGVGDSIVAVPVLPGPLRAPDTLRDVARRIAIEWLRPRLVRATHEFPKAPGPHMELANVLEAAGAITAPGLDRVTALREVVQARRLYPREYELQAIRVQIRLLLRAGEFGAAAALIDTALARTSSSNERDASIMAGPAMFGGHAAKATEILRTLSSTPPRQIRDANGRPFPVSPTAIASRVPLTVDATLGICNDDVRAMPAQLATLLAASFGNGEVPPVAEESFLDAVMVLDFPCFSSVANDVLRQPPTRLLRSARLMRPEYRSRLEGELASFARAHAQGSSIAPEQIWVEAEARLALGDSAGAMTILKNELDALPLHSSISYDNETRAGLAPRMMIAVADLAAARGDAALARKWGAAVAALWAHADPVLQPTVQRMRRYAGGTVSAR